MALGIQAADRFQEQAAAWCLATGHGYTELYNKLHDGANLDIHFVALRRELALVDAETARSYGAIEVEPLVRRFDIPAQGAANSRASAMRSAHLRLVRSAHEEHRARELRGDANGHA